MASRKTERKKCSF